MKYEPIETQPVIEAARFDLRPLRVSDKGLIERYAGDRRVAEMTSSIPHPLPPGATEAYMARARAEDRIEDVWAVDASRSGGADLVGLIALERMDRNQSEIGYWIAPAFWNSRLGREAVAALVAANPFGNEMFFAQAFQDNPASARVLTHSGFTYLGDAESYCVARGATVATWTYSKRAS